MISLKYYYHFFFFFFLKFALSTDKSFSIELFSSKMETSLAGWPVNRVVFIEDKEYLDAS